MGSSRRMPIFMLHIIHFSLSLNPPLMHSRNTFSGEVIEAPITLDLKLAI